MENISIYVSILFLLTVCAVVWLFFKAAHYSKLLMVIVLIWILIQCTLGISNFYTNWAATPPRLLFMIVAPLLAIVFLLTRISNSSFIDSLNIETLTVLHTIRIPVEITLYFLFVAKLIPRSMTFEGSNFDIVSGLTAPLTYLAIFKWRSDRRILLAWNFICLGLLLNVVITAILSAKTPFQQFAFDQPNIGIAYFPFVLLPSVVVPIVLLSHLASIRQILKRENAAVISVG